MKKSKQREGVIVVEVQEPPATKKRLAEIEARSAELLQTAQKYKPSRIPAEIRQEAYALIYELDIIGEPPPPAFVALFKIIARVPDRPVYYAGWRGDAIRIEAAADPDPSGKNPSCLSLGEVAKARWGDELPRGQKDLKRDWDEGSYEDKKKSIYRWRKEPSYRNSVAAIRKTHENANRENWHRQKETKRSKNRERRRRDSLFVVEKALRKTQQENE